MPAGRTYTPIARTVLTSSASSVTFSSINTSYTDLVVVIDGYNDTGANYWLYMQVGNGSIDTGNNYSFTNLYGTGSAAVSARGTSGPMIVGVIDSSNFKTTIVNLANYSNTTTYKTCITRSNNNAYVGSWVGTWRSTSAIDTIKFSVESSKSFVAGSTFTIYGIAAA